MAARPAHRDGHRLRRANDQAARAVQRLERIHPLRGPGGRGSHTSDARSLLASSHVPRPVEKLQVLFQAEDPCWTLAIEAIGNGDANSPRIVEADVRRHIQQERAGINLAGRFDHNLAAFKLEFSEIDGLLGSV